MIEIEEQVVQACLNYRILDLVFAKERLQHKIATINISKRHVDYLLGILHNGEEREEKDTNKIANEVLETKLRIKNLEEELAKDAQTIELLEKQKASLREDQVNFKNFDNVYDLEEYRIKAQIFKEKENE